MAWLNKIKSLSPISANIDVNITKSRQTLVRYSKKNIFELKTCIETGVIRERSWGRTERIDFYHKLEDGTLQITPSK